MSLKAKARGVASTGLLGLSGLVAAGSIGSCAVGALANTDGDGFSPRQTLTANLLGYDRGVTCYFDSGYETPWQCPTFTTYDPQSLKQHPVIPLPDAIRGPVAAYVPHLGEFLLAGALLALAVAADPRKYEQK